MERYHSASPAETREIAKRLAQSYGIPSALILLRGELGAGKTLFVGGFAAGLGIAEPITSPTFALANEYETANGISFYHLDCYRFEKPEELRELGLAAYLYPHSAITLIEWPERIEPLLPPVRIEIEIEVTSETERTITLFRRT